MSDGSDRDHEQRSAGRGQNCTSVKDLFAAALEAEEDGRDIESVLEGVDASIREAVEGLLRAHERATGRLLDATDDTQTGWTRLGIGRSGAGPAEIEAPVISGYEVGEEIGRGGFGVVFRGRQRVPVDRPVAIKLLRHDFATRSVVSRFRAEARVLARMNHPGIARVLDAGLDAKSRPYLVMELVEGRPIAEACEAGGLTVRERVALMAQVCEAVHHAHQRAIIHRDLKPANMLVESADGEPRARVIDFGIAKLLDREDGETMTLAGDRLGTPKYMSPEQLGGGDGADVRTDVYALGVVLCELLTGRVPPENEASASGSVSDHGSGSKRSGGSGRSGSFGQVTRPSVLAGSDPKTADRAKLLKGDLDRIVMKAVARYPEARYPSALAMAQDLRRYLDGLPVHATPPGRVYLVRKFIARHQAITAMAALLTIAVVGGLAALSYGMREAKLGRLEAENAFREEAIERARAQAMSDFLLGNMLTAIDPDLYQGEDRSLQEILRATAEEADSSLAEQPAVLLRVLERIGQSQRAIGDSFGAAATLTRAAGLSAEQRGPYAAETIELNLDVLLAHFSSRVPLNYDAEIDRLQALAAENLPTGHAVRYRTELYELHSMPRHERAEYARRMEERIASSEHRGSALHYEAMRYLASVLLSEDPGSSLEIAERALADAVERYGSAHSQTIEIRFIYAQALSHAGRVDDAEREFRLLLEHSATLGGEQSVYFQTALSNLIRMLNVRGRFEEAVALARSQEQRALAQYGPRSSYYMLSIRQVARCYRAASDWDRAEREYERAAGLYSRLDWMQVVESMETRTEWAEMLLEADRADRVEGVLSPVLGKLRVGHELRSIAVVLKAEALAAADRLGEAIELVERELADAERETGARPQELVDWLGAQRAPGA
ncbi:MAG: protein kinase [Phycisphaerales bacterium]